MIGGASLVRHAIVGVAIGGTTLLAATGVIGGGADPERFDAKTVVVAKIGDDVRITEFVDIDFGSEDRRGYERVVPIDFGRPVDIVAASPDAADNLNVTEFERTTRIRIGDPDRTFSGQHRYELSYTLPDPMFDELGLDLDLVSPPGDGFPGDQETLVFDVVVTGFELTNAFCDVGAFGATGGCELVDDGAVYRARVAPLEARAGLSIGGDITGERPLIEIAAPPIPERRSEPSRLPVALGTAALGVGSALAVYRWARRRGSNEVFAGGAADAAYGAMPAPRPDGTVDPPPPIRLVPDDEMDELATIEFVPPKGIDPWEGAVLLDERLGDDQVEAWLSGMVGREAVELDESGDELVVSSGPRRDELEAHDAALLSGLLSIADPYTTGTYDPEFATAWRAVHQHQRAVIAASGWWTRLPPGAGFRPSAAGSARGLLMLAVFAIVWFSSAISSFAGVFGSWPLALGLGMVFPAIVAFFVYRALLPARSAQGSALALRTESFRRFLHASEARHVEWAWTHGVLREYSAWAVALGEADAWSGALAQANVPAPAIAAAAPIIVHRHAPSMQSSRTAPSQSSSGGGFSGGGGSGGGGGGGSSGSW